MHDNHICSEANTIALDIPYEILNSGLFCVCEQFLHLSFALLMLIRSYSLCSTLHSGPGHLFLSSCFLCSGTEAGQSHSWIFWRKEPGFWVSWGSLQTTALSFFHLGQVQKHHQVLCSDRAVGRPLQLLYSHSDHHGDNPTALSQWDRGAVLHPLRLAVWMPCSQVHTMNIAQKPSCLIWSFMMEELHNASLIFSVHCLIH